MQIKRDARVVTADGKDVGHVERVVIDPGTRDLSHLIVTRGWLFKEDRVLPFSLVAHTTEDEIRLNATRETLESLPLFQETSYVAARDPEPGYTAPYLFYPVGLSGVPAMIPQVHPEITQTMTTSSNIPDEAVALKEGARVVSADQEHVGNIEQVNLDRTGRTTHFVIASGLINREHRVIPYIWVKSVTEDEVQLYVNAEVIRRLRTQEAATR